MALQLQTYHIANKREIAAGDRTLKRQLDKRAAGLLLGAVRYDERQYNTNEAQVAYSLPNASGRGAKQIGLLPGAQSAAFDDLHGKSARFGWVPDPSVNDLFDGTSTSLRSRITYEPETPNRKQSAGAGYFVEGTEGIAYPSEFPGLENDAYLIRKKLTAGTMKHSGELYPEGKRIDKGGYNGGSGLGATYPQYSVNSVPLLPGAGSIRVGGTSDDTVNRLRAEQNLRANKYYLDRIGRANAQAAANQRSLARGLAV